ncbi:MAG: hemolysin family protein [Synergistaceae bacterium]|jgi:CBS domain containing-hemolysin-like protein|nr:hemolysin family protein [Synergistaceae bacterium]
MSNGFLLVFLLIVISAFFSMAEISLAASRRMKLRVLLDEGKSRAAQILGFQEQPGMFFTTVQIGLNSVAILAGIVGDSFLSPPVADVFSGFASPALAESAASVVSFLLVTLLFILFADVIPKRVAMAFPEKVALCLVEPMKNAIFLLTPLSVSLNSLAGAVFGVLKMPEKRREDITSDDIQAVMEAGAMAGILRSQEKELIGNVFELDSRTVPSAMTVRENVVYFDFHESEESIRAKIAEYPHSTYLVCEGGIDHVIGYVDSKELLERVVKGQSLKMANGLQLRAPLILPDTLTLAESIDQFKGQGEDLAVVLNEYALVVGIISLRDIMTMLMGTLVGEEEQIMKRDDHSWLIDGATPIDDVMSVFRIEEFPHDENYETIGGFMTYMLRRIPRRTDFVHYAGYKFEVMDIDNYKIDQILVTKIDEKAEKQKKNNGAPPHAPAGDSSPALHR